MSDSLSVPFTGPAVTPPRAAFWLALGRISDPTRPRAEKDQFGRDCNDYAHAAVQSLEKEGRQPYYMAVINERGDGHMIAVYPTRDGTIYARDNRVSTGDIPLQHLLGLGYRPLATSDPKAQMWYGPER